MERRLVNKIILFFMLFFLGSASVLFAWNVKNSDTVMPRSSGEWNSEMKVKSDNSSNIIMPSISAPAKTDTEGNIVFSFNNGILLRENIRTLLAEVSYGNSFETECWILNPKIISIDGKSMQMQIGKTLLNHKTVQFQFYAVDNQGKYILPSNKINILLDNDGLLK